MPPIVSGMEIGLDDVFAARQRIDAIITRTPLLPSTLDGELLLKLESMQPIRAFKLRGAANAIACLSEEERARGVVCCSTGNHGRGVAYAAKQAGVQASVCLSDMVPEVKAKAIEALGAKLCRAGKTQEEALAETKRIVAEENAYEISPFDDTRVIAGQATIALELFEQRPDLNSIVIPVSGGGLAGGIAFAAKQIQPRCQIIGVSVERGAGMHASLQAGHPVEVEEYPSLADSMGGNIGMNNRFTFHLCQQYLDDIVLVSEQEIYAGMRALFQHESIVAEGGAAVCHGALLAGKLKLKSPSAFIISGANVDMSMFRQIINGETLQLGDLEVGL